MPAPEIAIIGGGPCGLILARLLESKGVVDYLVYERDESDGSNPNEGGSLDLHPETGQRALQEAGLFGEFERYARYDDTVFTITDKLGNRLVEIGQGRDAPEIDRHELRHILLNSIPKEKIKWGHSLTIVTLGEDGKHVLHFGNGLVISGVRLIVGADGAWSKVRPMVCITQATPKYTGKTVLATTISNANPLYETTAAKVGPGSSLAISSGKYIMTQRQGDGSYRTSFGVHSLDNNPFSGDIETTRRLLLSSTYYADWSEDHKALIRQATHLRAWPLHSLAAEDMGWMSVPGLTLTGDAAHLSFIGGEGVNMAMADSLQLALKIVEHGMNNLDQAVREYESGMFPRGIAGIEEGKVMESVMHGEDPGAFIQLVSS
ncbi:hypothetical protein B0T17DRAFT_589375 [Bombardia bombarda]|uniref:FAD-binding domain-containing protein n=1 Tax=Bombardia bombarda TaxID=252184 RepID=A0AA39X996_9PEZI|nr:hypothetical protein B0T17DRAFT_589375 [Bombardia bombarda]